MQDKEVYFYLFIDLETTHSIISSAERLLRAQSHLIPLFRAEENQRRFATSPKTFFKLQQRNMFLSKHGPCQSGNVNATQRIRR